MQKHKLSLLASSAILAGSIALVSPPTEAATINAADAAYLCIPLVVDCIIISVPAPEAEGVKQYAGWSWLNNQSESYLGQYAEAWVALPD